jgi:hypothetical protein
MATMDFLRSLLSGEKQMFKMNVVKFVQVKERYSELSLENLLHHCNQEAPECLNYFPNNPIPVKLCRTYVMNVMNTVHEGIIEDMWIAALKRAKTRNADQTVIVLKDEFAGLLTNQLFPMIGSTRLLTSLSRRQP